MVVRKRLRLGWLFSSSTGSPSLWSLPLFDVVLDNARSTVRALANLVAVEMLEFRAEGPVDVVVLSGESVLAFIA
jgi:hypothetical protein